MSEVRLVVRERERDWSGKIHGSCADRAVAALSADPVTLEDLELAVSRFAKPDADFRYFVNLSRGLCDEPYDAGLVVIDLVARLVVVDSTYSSPGKRDSVCYHDGRCATSVDLPYCLADDWLFTSDSQNWQALADARRQERAAQPLRDLRDVFYGRPLLEFIAREVFAAFARRDEIAGAAKARREEEERERQARYPEAPRERPTSGDAELDEDFAAIDEDEGELESRPEQQRYAGLFYDTIRQIHADWLLTPRADLGGACPREIALDRHNHISRDIEDRCLHWSRLNECPPGLEPSSHAYRYGGFGTHELVKYYDLVRQLGSDP